MIRQRKYTRKLMWLLLALPLSLLFCLSTGEANINFTSVWTYFTNSGTLSEAELIILHDFRMPEALTAMIASAALAVSGLIMQAYFRNPLAGPSVMGVSSGASLGIVLLLVCFPGWLGEGISGKIGTMLAASIGSIGVLALLSLIQFRLKSVETLLIIGLLLTYFISATETLLLSNTNAQNIKTFVQWGFGSFSKTDYNDIGILFLSCTMLIFCAFLTGKKLDAFQYTDETILNAGIRKNSNAQLLIVLSGLLCSIVTAYCGPIAFIGLCVPHIARLFLKTTRHFYLLLACLLIAMHLGLICTAVSRLTLFGQNLPINSITSFLGAPFIIYILIQTRKNKLA